MEREEPGAPVMAARRRWNPARPFRDGEAVDAWPALPVAQWDATRNTVHLWSQVVGKTRLALTPMQNHWWNVPLYVNSVGLTTSLLPVGSRGGLEVIFDFVDHELRLRLTDGRRRHLQLAPRSVADFYAEYLRKLAELDVDVVLKPMPTEIPDAVPSRLTRTTRRTTRLP